MSEQFQKAVRDADLISGCTSGFVAAIIMSYVASVTEPGIIHLLLAFVAVGAVVGAYLFVGRSKVEPEWKATAIIGGGAASVLSFVLLSLQY